MLDEIFFNKNVLMWQKVDTKPCPGSVNLKLIIWAIL